MAYSGRGGNNLGTIKNDDMDDGDFEQFCRTTFAGGINPFIAAGAVRLMPAYEPASRVAGVFCVTQNDILVVLRDGKERRICEVADATGGELNNVGQTLAKMATAGLIKREMRRVPGRKSVPFYSIWGTE